MGIRPSMCLVFGIDNYEGESRWEKWEATSLAVPEEEIRENPFPKAYLKDVFYNRKSEEWGTVADHIFIGHYVDGVVGLTLKCMDYDSIILRSLAIFHKEYQLEGKHDIPVLNADANENLYYVLDIKKHKSHYNCGDIDWQWGWFYPSMVEVLHMWPVRAYCTRYLLDRAGIASDYHDYRAMLVWEWS